CARHRKDYYAMDYW
nr:immunoglobulin heavy chain junction region [Mus musculus]